MNKSNQIKFHQEAHRNQLYYFVMSTTIDIIKIYANTYFEQLYLSKRLDLEMINTNFADLDILMPLNAI